VTIAITRRISPSIDRCELTHLDRTPIDFERACAQHLQYEEALSSLGVEVVTLDAEPDLPDSVFVEDAALVLDECAVLTRPGAESRRPEVATVAGALAPHRSLLRILPPATVDGGDILTVGRTIFIGVTSRSTGDAVDQMRAILEPYSYEVRAVEVSGCLHLKSAVTQVGENTVLLNPEWVSPDAFPDLEILDIDPAEPGAANALLIDGTIIYPSSFPRTQAILNDAGVPMVIVDADELAKAEGAVTCCSLIIR